jgi:hypothetical protein
MKYQHILIIILTACLFATGCSSPIDKEYEKLYAEVMLIHDEAMSEMHQLVMLKKQIQSDTVLALSTQGVEAIQMLEKADKHMMVWMRNFKKPTQVDEAAVAYLEKQLESVQLMADEIYAAIENAQSLIKER